MRALRGLEALPDPERDRGCVATIGVFDGVHLGHFQVLRTVVERAQELGMGSTVVTFGGHPKEVLTGRAPATVTSLEHRLLLFERIGLETCLVLEFTDELRQHSAEDFVRKILLEGLGVRELVLGFDSKFGRDRGGNVESLQPLAQELGFGLREVPPLRIQGRAVSSSAVREAVHLGEFERAAAMLGRPVSLLGTVVRGDGRGRELGYPTANLDLHHELRPPDGVYAALVLRMGELIPAVVNVGNRPTFGNAGFSVEVHLLDQDSDLYGEDLEVFFLELIRAERAFADGTELADQIRQDVEDARAAIISASRNWRIPGEYLPIEGPGATEVADAPS